jgi:putative NIF3 family GTP cyclohydrolase 1 type 2
MELALADALGWAKYRVKAGDVLYDIPPASAEQVVANIRKRLKLNGGLRAVGDRTAQVRRILLQPGAMTPATMWTRYTEADLIIAGEVREWENTHFAADLFTAGEKHGLVTIGRVVSEDPGMQACSEWVKTIVKEMPVQWIAAGDAYWRAV